jgi:hypothetical protein
MSTVLRTALALFLLATAARADVTKEDIKKFLQVGISEDTIVLYIKTHGPVSPLSADDLAELKKLGASDKVLIAMMPGPDAKKPEARPQGEPGPAQPAAPTVVYEPSDYSSYTLSVFSYPYYGYGYGYPYYPGYCYPYYRYWYGSPCYPGHGWTPRPTPFVTTGRPFVGFTGHSFVGTGAHGFTGSAGMSSGGGHSGGHR